MEVLFFVGFAILAVGGIALSFYLAKKRREEMQRFAASRGLQYSDFDRFQLHTWPFALFSVGQGRRANNVIWGPWKGADWVTAFDYQYYTESTDSKGHRTKHYHRFSCAQIEVPAAFPHLQIARENIFTRMADGLGMADIELELPEFNRRYNVKGGQRKFAYELLDQRMLDWLVRFDQGYAFEVLGSRILAYRKRTNAAGLEPLIGTLLMFRDHVPRVAWGLYPQA